MPGVVYFLQAQPGGPVKIGYAKNRQNVETRLRAAQLGHPAPLRVLAVIPGGPVLEQQLHQRFANDRTHGEWFRPSPALLGLIAASQAPTLDLRDTVDVEAIRTPPAVARKRRVWPWVALAAVTAGGLAAQASPHLAIPAELAVALGYLARRGGLMSRVHRSPVHQRSQPER